MNGGAAPPSPPLPTHGEALFCISLPQARHSAVPRGGSPLAPTLGVPDGALPPLENTKLKGNYV